MAILPIPFIFGGYFFSVVLSTFLSRLVHSFAFQRSEVFALMLRSVLHRYLV